MWGGRSLLGMACGVPSVCLVNAVCGQSSVGHGGRWWRHWSLNSEVPDGATVCDTLVLSKRQRSRGALAGFPGDGRWGWRSQQQLVRLRPGGPGPTQGPSFQATGNMLLLSPQTRGNRS